MLTIDEINRVKREGWRIVRSAKRARKIRRRGDYIEWNTYLDTWIWQPDQVSNWLIGMSKFCDCCVECAAVPCDGVMAGDICDQRCHCEDFTEFRRVILNVVETHFGVREADLCDQRCSCEDFDNDW